MITTGITPSCPCIAHTHKTHDHHMMSMMNTCLTPTQPPSPSPSHETTQQEERKFIMFTKVLMQYLKTEDSSMHLKAKEAIRDCVQKNDDGVPGYSPLMTAIKFHLYETVGDVFWRQAKGDLKKHLHERLTKRKRSNCSPESVVTAASNFESPPARKKIRNNYDDRSKGQIRPSQSTSPKVVKFDKIEIRNYDLTVGDNPSCSKAPISLSWTYDPVEEVYSIDDYEEQRGNHGKAKRWSENDRNRILIEWNVPLSQIMEASNECQVIYKQRIETIRSLSKK